MPEKIVTRLQAMHHSNQLSSFIVSTLPTGKLATGWIEQGLVGKGFSGNVPDKTNQEDLVIPIDRFSRLTKDFGTKINNGLFILGEQGQDRPKFVTLVGDLNLGKAGMKAVGFNTADIEVMELFDIISRIVLQKTKSKISSDPNLDYVEDLLTDAASGHISSLLALSLSSGKLKVIDWIRRILKTDLNSKEVIACYGDVQKVSSSILLLSRWLLGLEIFKKTTNVIATVMLIQESQIVFVFWDSPQNIATFGVINGIDVERALRKYCLPLWYTPTSVPEQKSRGPKVVIEKQGKKKAKTRKKTKPDEQVTPDGRTVTMIRTRLTELIKRLNLLVSHIGTLEKRIIKITRDTRFQSMSEHSESAIEELRRIEKETNILEALSGSLRQLEMQIDNAASSDSTNTSLSSEEIQNIVSKMAMLRNLIDKIEVEIGQLDSRVSEIDSLKFKHRTES